MDAVKYVASRYCTTPEKVLKHYFIQTGVFKSEITDEDDDYVLLSNELALFHDLGIQPTAIEMK